MLSYLTQAGDRRCCHDVYRGEEAQVCTGPQLDLRSVAIVEASKREPVLYMQYETLACRASRARKQLHGYLVNWMVQ